MNYYTYTLTTIQQETQDSYIVQLTPHNKNKIIEFTAGQYCFLKNPLHPNTPDEARPFSIASSPYSPNLEFCIKTYGDWTKSLITLAPQMPILVSQPQGTFVWDNTITHAVFLVGGVGISPVMAMLRFLRDMQKNLPLILFYGNKTLENVAYKEELENITVALSKLQTIHVFSHLPKDHPWTGYRGFLTEDLLKKEINFLKNPTFFLIGTPVFIDKMKYLLKVCNVEEKQIKEELLSKK